MDLGSLIGQLERSTRISKSPLNVRILWFVLFFFFDITDGHLDCTDWSQKTGIKPETVCCIQTSATYAFDNTDHPKPSVNVFVTKSSLSIHVAPSGRPSTRIYVG